MEKIYLDHNATTPTHPEVVKAMLPYYNEVYGNPSSIHHFGQEARKAVDEAREKVADFIGAKPEELVFTSGGTEANNFAIKGIAYANGKKRRYTLNRTCSPACQSFAGRGSGHIITSSIEHHAVLNPCKYLEGKGFKVTFLPVDEYGVVNPDDVSKAITDETILITIMHANNEVGTIEPIEEIGKIAKEKGILFHTDAVQAIGKIAVNVDKLNVDLLSLSGHKIYGPKGIGALYIRKGTRIEPLILGGHHERNRRAGTENVPGIVGLGKAIEIAYRDMEEENRRTRLLPTKEGGQVIHLRDRLWNGLRQKIGSIQLNGHPLQTLNHSKFGSGQGLPNTLNVSFKFVEGESIILNLDLQGIAVSSGSACTSGSLEPSHVLKAMSVDPATAQGSIRFSLGRNNTEDDIDYVLKILPEIIDRLRTMSPLYGRKK